LGSGSSTQYTKTISIKSNDVNVKVVTGTDASSCATGALYTGGDVRLNLSGTSVNNNSFSQNQIANAGTAKFTCVPDAKTTYDLTAVPPAGYSIINATNTPDAGTWTTGDSTISIPVKQTETATFCIAPINPWFQTDLGDVRFNRLNNPVPKGQTASTSTSYPGIFYSSDIDASFGDGNVSTKNWVVNNEDSYNTKTQNRNGSISYDFYKSKALKEAVSIIPIPDDGIVDVNSLKSGVYEATGTTGNITINSDTTITGKHIILLTKGTVTIKGNITVPSGGKGLFILASKDDMIVTPTVTNLDGYYSSQKDIAIQSTDPTCKTNTDQQLVVNGALISNALKPFANEPTGKINLQRTLCINNQSQPALKLNFRPDFLIQLTDFYKTTYTKWSEVNP
jgi:hypothetical protein